MDLGKAAALIPGVIAIGKEGAFMSAAYELYELGFVPNFKAALANLPTLAKNGDAIKAQKALDVVMSIMIELAGDPNHSVVTMAFINSALAA